MDPALFAEFLKRVREGGRILCGEEEAAQPGRGRLPSAETPKQRGAA
jgi:hypothetical protein